MTQNNNTAKKIADTPKPAELIKGESRNIVAKKVGLKSGHEVDRSIKAINTIDELTEKGRTEKGMWCFTTHLQNDSYKIYECCIKFNAP